MSIETQKSNLEQYKIQLDDARTSAMISIRNSYNTIENAQNQLKTYESNLELMQKTYDMTLIAYNNGSKDLSALETAQDNLSSARFSLQNQKYTIINAVLNLENTLGVPFGTLSKGSDVQ
jgi:outer membrane protein